MAMQSSETHPALSRTDGIASASGDVLVLVGRILLGWLFLASGWGKFMNIAGTTAYFTGLQLPSPEIWTWVAVIIELVLGVTLILGIATRYAALAAFVFVLVATVIAHRYWTYPAAQQGAQYANMLKNLAIMGGALLAFVTGAGRVSLDTWIAKR